MWNFRIGCFVTLCGLLWIAVVASPFQTVKGSLSVLPVLGVLGIAHLVGIMGYVDKAGPSFQRFWVGCVCGATDAALTLVFLLIATATMNGEKDGVEKAVLIIAWCLPFVLPQLLSPRIVASFVAGKD